MTPSFQYRDPLIGVLDYIIEVRLSKYGAIRINRTQWAPKEMSLR
jgi:hypothetical protein